MRTLYRLARTSNAAPLYAWRWEIRTGMVALGGLAAMLAGVH